MSFVVMPYNCRLRSLEFPFGSGCGEEALGGKKHEGDSARLLLACVFLTYVLCLLYVNKKKKGLLFYSNTINNRHKWLQCTH